MFLETDWQSSWPQTHTYARSCPSPGITGAWLTKQTLCGFESVALPGVPPYAFGPFCLAFPVIIVIVIIVVIAIFIFCVLKGYI